MQTHLGLLIVNLAMKTNGPSKKWWEWHLLKTYEKTHHLKELQEEILKRCKQNIQPQILMYNSHTKTNLAPNVWIPVTASNDFANVNGWQTTMMMLLMVKMMQADL